MELIWPGEIDSRYLFFTVMAQRGQLSRSESAGAAILAVMSVPHQQVGGDFTVGGRYKEILVSQRGECSKSNIAVSPPTLEVSDLLRTFRISSFPLHSGGEAGVELGCVYSC